MMFVSLVFYESTIGVLVLSQRFIMSSPLIPYLPTHLSSICTCNWLIHPFSFHLFSFHPRIHTTINLTIILLSICPLAFIKAWLDAEYQALLQVRHTYLLWWWAKENFLLSNSLLRLKDDVSFLHSHKHLSPTWGQVGGIGVALAMTLHRDGWKDSHTDRETHKNLQTHQPGLWWCWRRHAVGGRDSC